MIHQIPDLEGIDNEVLEMIRGQRETLKYQVGQTPLRWSGFLRKNTEARALQGSNSIEGINANLDEAVAIVDDERPETLEEETVRALQGYRSAMTYIIRIHDDQHTKVDSSLIRSLHFMMISYDMSKMPGQWRPTPVYVVNEADEEIFYEGPAAERVPKYMSELVDQINNPFSNSDNSLVIGAMAHLNLAMIHPFKDGNGRMARALQTLVISRNGISSPTFCSIEEWLGRNTPSYYDVLKQVGQGSWNPRNSALPWVRFCLIAHYQQQATLTRRNNHVGRVWNEISKMIKDLGFPERMDGAILQAAFGYRVRSNRYREEEGLSDVVATRDLKKLCDAGLLVPIGEKRGRFYVADRNLLEIAERTKDRSRSGNPYEIAGKGRAQIGQLELL